MCHSAYFRASYNPGQVTIWCKAKTESRPKMKSAAQLAYLRQLCCLGLGGQIIMPDVMRALHGIIPSAFNHFLWADENYQASAVLWEETLPEALETLYFKEYHNSKEADALKTTFSEAMRRGRDWVNSE